MPALSTQLIDQFWQDGCLLCSDGVSAAQLAALRSDLDIWIEESRNHDGPYGQMLDGRPRFDVQPGHCAEAPALRRVASPTELSPAYLDVLQNSPMIDLLTGLIGPDLRLHHSKVNSKLPGSATLVDWHQDFGFDPHSNDDVITCLIFLDDVSMENGPLMTVPGSHRGPLYTHWQDGRFIGAVDAKTAAAFEAEAVCHTGPAGSICFMHSRTAHASTANGSDKPRSLFISAIAAADAVPLAANAVPSIHEGLLLRGREPGRIRSQSFSMDMPEVPKGASFFEQQSDPTHP